jgi:hypothetical protein
MIDLELFFREGAPQHDVDPYFSILGQDNRASAAHLEVPGEDCGEPVGKRRIIEFCGECDG